MPPVLAHFGGGGHWLTYVLYSLPLLVCIGLIVISFVSDRRRAGDEPAPEPAGDGKDRPSTDEE